MQSGKGIEFGKQSKLKSHAIRSVLLFLPGFNIFNIAFLLVTLQPRFSRPDTRTFILYCVCACTNRRWYSGGIAFINFVIDLHPHQYVEQYSTLPFPCVSQKWYERQYTLATKSVARERYQAERDMLTDKKGNVVCINRSTKHESIKDGINTLWTQISEADGSRRKHLEAILVVAKHILANGPIVKTQELGRLCTRKVPIMCMKENYSIIRHVQ